MLIDGWRVNHGTDSLGERLKKTEKTKSNEIFRILDMCDKVTPPRIGGGVFFLR